MVAEGTIDVFLRDTGGTENLPRLPRHRVMVQGLETQTNPQDPNAIPQMTIERPVTTAGRRPGSKFAKEYHRR